MSEPVLHLILGLVLILAVVKLAFRLAGAAAGAAASGFKAAFTSGARPRGHIVVGTPGGPVAVPLPRDPAERFYAVAEAYGRDEEDLMRIERAVWRSFAAYLLMGPVVAVAVAWQWHAMQPIARFAYSFFAVPWALLTFRAAYEHWLVRRRSLDHVGVFLLRPREWWPPSHCMEEVPLRRPLSMRDRVDVVRVYVRAVIWTAAWRVGLRKVPPAPPGAKRITHVRVEI
jgi:hypothetical protein